MPKAGLEATFSGPVIKVVDFKPEDQPGKHYTSFELGYMGGSVKFHCSPDQLSGVQEGSMVTVKAAVSCKGKEARFDAVQLKAA